MNKHNRFTDENLKVSNFYNEVLVVCPICTQKANTTVSFETKIARFLCLQCGHNKEASIILYNDATLKIPSNMYFNAQLWLQATFKNDVFYAYNNKHLAYLERYIYATIREHKDRTGFTLLEKLPKFYHEAKNREALLKIINKLKSK